MAKVSHMRQVDHYEESGGLQAELVEGIIVPKGGKNILFSEIRSKFRVRSDDVFIACYPKTGTNWLLLIAKLIRNNGVEDGVDIRQAIPMVDSLTAEESEAMSSPRAFRTHVPYQIFPGGEPATTSAKYIYLYRNPKDAAVSMYHFITGFTFVPSFSWDDFFDLFISGNVPYGPILDHMAQWWKHRDAKNILIMNFESMKKDPPRTIRTIADFMGYRLSPETISKIAEQTTFEAMRQNPAANRADTDARRVTANTSVNRKGAVGDWRNHFTAEQSAMMDEECAKIFAGSGLEFDYGPQLPSSKL